MSCPKCETPFAIPRPATIKAATDRKKAKPATPPISYEPRFSLADYGLSPALIGLFLVLLGLNLVLFLLQSSLIFFAFILSVLIAMGCLIAGGLALLSEAGRESSTEHLLCLVIPFYIIYYGISRFEETKRETGVIAGSVILIMVSYLFTFSFRSSPSQNAEAQNPDLPPELVKDIEKHREINEKLLENIKQKPDTNPHDLIKPGRLPGSKFDLSDAKPVLMSWPTAGVRGSNTYLETETGSIANVYEVTSSAFSPGKPPANSKMKFRVYLPPGIDPASPVPCVIIPPAGSNLLSGMEIDPPDLIPNPEHEPYIKAGFAVVTFSIDGPLLKGEESNNIDLRNAYEAFQNSKAGLVNCLRAFLETQAVIPGIDKNKVFIAGHSSAGTLSLLFAEHYPQIKGCLAYAPSVDLENNFKPHLAEIKQLLPGVEDFIKKSSPKTHITSLTCPVFLFHARQDQVTSFADTQNFANQLKRQGTDVEFVVGTGGDHYQSMISEGLPQGIEWIKKIVAKTKPSSPNSKMAGTTGNPAVPTPTPFQMDLNRHKVKLKVIGFDDFYTKAIQSKPDFWKKSIESKVQSGLKEIVPQYVKESINLDLTEMTLSFQYLGDLPADIAQKFADNRLTRAVKLDGQTLSISQINNNPNTRIMDDNFLTFRIRSLIKGRFNRNASPQIAEVNLKQIDRYVPDSLVINYDKKWVNIKLKGIGDKSEIQRKVIQALFTAGLIVTAEKIDLTDADLAMNGAAGASSPKSNTPRSTQPVTGKPASTTRQKYVIQYGVYSGKNAKASAQRSLKGFVWVEQSSFQFNPYRKEISFINRSAVDNGALERALTRNKFYQLKITQEAIPEEKLDAEKSESEKNETKVSTE
ncbi:Alpha/beta hydrolase family protein [Gimesia alba]|uniref:Alpha/beta hydrolase family protein n=1 Tax=Gimesia alba TaxID=2527973 RepID=A0A517RKE9_9PLAN|nr:prolyl oligopeptidase family serine peptidase [Gimesia alba]QDT44358.1 Alpha/beta hydrolase family protein [Gimesia alba]